jgi:tetratricopeptide (TPR) repeat protein
MQGGNPQMKAPRLDWACRHAALLIFLTALSVRLIYLAQIQDLPFTSHLSLDATAYDRMAQDIARGNWLGDTVFYQAPLYPYFLAVFYKWFGHSLNVIRWIQLLLGAFNCVVTFWIAKKLFGANKALWAGLMVAFYGIFVFYEGAIGKDGISYLLTNLTLLSLVSCLENPKWQRWFLSGIALGCSILTRGNLILLLPFILLWMAIALRPHPLRMTLGAIAIFVTGTFLVISPVTIRNYVIGQDWVLTTSQAGQNFYIGNNPKASGFFENPPRIRLNPEYEEEDFKSEALRITNRDFMKPSEISGFWFKQGLRFIQTNPGKAFELLVKKTAMFWNRFEIPDNYNYYYYRKETPILSVLFLGFGFVAPLGLLGLFLGRRKPETWLFSLFILGYMASIVPFHMASRYRLPVVPPLIVFASYSLAWTLEAIRKKAFKSLLLALLPATLLAIAVNWKVVAETTTFKAPYTELGIIAAESNDFTEAMAYFKKALEIDPGYATAHYNMGITLVKQGDYQAAVVAFKEAVRYDPEFLMAYDNLGKTYLRLEKFDEALSAFDEALLLRPDFAQALVGKGIVYHSLGRYTLAIDTYDKAIGLQPSLAPAHYNLACAYAKNGDIDKARTALKQAVALNVAYERQARVDKDLEILRTLGNQKRNG